MNVNEKGYTCFFSLRFRKNCYFAKFSIFDPFLTIRDITLN